MLRGIEDNEMLKSVSVECSDGYASPIFRAEIETDLKNQLSALGILCGVAKSREIVRVNEIVKDKVVEVEFADGDIQKSVCREPDVFSMDMAITICICKHLIGGTKVFNDAVKKGMKVYEYCLKEKKRQQEERERSERRKAKKIERKQRRRAAAREEQIEIQKEAYLRAMREKELEQAKVI